MSAAQRGATAAKRRNVAQLPSQSALLDRCITKHNLKPKKETWSEVLFELVFSEDMGAIILIFVLYLVAFGLYCYHH